MIRVRLEYNGAPLEAGELPAGEVTMTLGQIERMLEEVAERTRAECFADAGTRAREEFDRGYLAGSEGGKVQMVNEVTIARAAERERLIEILRGNPGASIETLIVKMRAGA